MHQRLLKIAKLVMAELDTGNVLTTALDEAIDLCGAERGMILLFKPDGSLHFDTARNLDRRDIENPEFKISRSIIREVRRTGVSALHTDLLAHPGTDLGDSVHRLGLLAVICLPLTREGEVFGVVYLDNRTRRHAFTPEALGLAEAFGDFISVSAYNALERDELRSRVSSLEEQLRKGNRFEAIIGASPAMLETLQLVAQVARSDATVLIEGESGTGKELIARAIHGSSDRREGPFVPINCGALPESLQESELFGHVEGAFTSAGKDRPGWVERAAGGTLFLDEVGEMSPPLQVKFLRVLENAEYSPVGSTEIRRSDVRIVAATNRPLASLVEAGKVRQDLHYRLDVFRVPVPPLRKRRSDVSLLARHFLDRPPKDREERRFDLSPAARERLESYDFPGNVRELKNILDRAMLLASGSVIDLAELPDTLEESPPSSPPAAPEAPLGPFRDAKQQVLEQFERSYIERALTETGGNITRAARLASMDVKNFHTKVTRYGIDARAFRKK